MSQTTFKIVLVGKFGVGKTSIIHQYIHEEFVNDPPAIESQTRDNVRNKMTFNVELIDSMGIEKDDPNNTFYFQKCHGCALVFDKNDEDSYTFITEMIDKVKLLGPYDMKMILIGNKSDLESKVNDSIIQQFATDNQMRYFSITAREKAHVIEALEYLVDLIHKRYFTKKKTCCIM